MGEAKLGKEGRVQGRGERLTEEGTEVEGSRERDAGAAQRGRTEVGPRSHHGEKKVGAGVLERGLGWDPRRVGVWPKLKVEPGIQGDGA